MEPSNIYKSVIRMWAVFLYLAGPKSGSTGLRTFNPMSHHFVKSPRPVFKPVNMKPRDNPNFIEKFGKNPAPSNSSNTVRKPIIVEIEVWSPVGKTSTPSKLNPSKQKYAPWNVTEECASIINGKLLGDGHIQKRGNSWRLKIVQKDQDYVEWAYDKLRPLWDPSYTAGIPRKITKRPSDGCYEFCTPSNIALAPFHDAFYETHNKSGKVNYVKNLSPKTFDFLTKVKNNSTLATFYMDDGSARDDCYSGKLATQGFSLESNRLLSKYIEETWSVKTNVVLNSRKKDQYYLSIPAKEYSKFIDVVQPILSEIGSMTKKLNVDNKGKSKFK